MISVTDARKAYGTFQALDNVSLEIPSGTLTALLGPSGSGKSTLLRVIAGLEDLDAGAVVIAGNDVTRLPPQQRGIGFVFQHYAAFKHMTVRDNVAFGLTIRKRPKAEVAKRVGELLEVVGLAGFQHRYPAQLSGGQRQRVGIARALATDPDVLLCDEPTSALDPKTTGEILDLIASLKARLRLAVLIITHEMSVVKRICDSVSLLQAGRVVESGTLVEVVSRFGSRLSELLLALPPSTDGAADELATVEVLDTVAPGDVPALTAVGREFGVDLPVLAGTVETLAGITFQRHRVLVPAPLEADDVVSALRRRGAQAAAHTGGSEVTR